MTTARRTLLLCLLILAAVSLQSGGASELCADKVLLVMRNAKLHHAYAAVRPAAIVIYAQLQRSHLAGAIRDPQFQTSLKLAGHRLTIAEDETTLKRALASNPVDVVLTDVADVDRASQHATVSPSKPVVLGVVYEPSVEEARRIEARYHCRFQQGDRADRYLVVIDDVMNARTKKKAS